MNYTVRSKALNYKSASRDELGDANVVNKRRGHLVHTLFPV